mmetsp:Transcript_12773/g.26885  ORF Transcript_12773/g.26885 Transcript_12773/m.26885 type:complete len:202 (+) Transcript_12773:279-884(+)
MYSLPRLCFTLDLLAFLGSLDCARLFQSCLLVLKGNKIHHVVRPPRHFENGVLQLWFQDDLTPQPRGLLRIVGQIDHVQFGLGWFAYRFKPLGLDDNVAGRAGHDPAAGAFDHLSKNIGVLSVPEFGDVRQRHVFESLNPKGPFHIVLYSGIVVAFLRGPGIRWQHPKSHRFLAGGPGQLYPDALHQRLQAGIFVDLPPAG